VRETRRKLVCAAVAAFHTRPDDHRRARARQRGAEGVGGKSLTNRAQEWRTVRAVRLVEAILQCLGEELGEPSATAAPSRAARPTVNAASQGGVDAGRLARPSAGGTLSPRMGAIRTARESAATRA